jgi:hypothetical protein
LNTTGLRLLRPFSEGPGRVLSRGRGNATRQIDGGATTPIEQRGGSRWRVFLVRQRSELTVRSFYRSCRRSRGFWEVSCSIRRTVHCVDYHPIRCRLFSLAWNQNNEIVAAGSLLRSSIRRFRLQDRQTRSRGGHPAAIGDSNRSGNPLHRVMGLYGIWSIWLRR